MAPKPMCECGTCQLCKNRLRNREWWRNLPPERRRELIARRDPEKVRANDRARYEREREKRIARSVTWAREDRKRHPEKWQARNAVANAIRDGRLEKQPCEVCGSTKVEAHHMDYSLPLEVRWFCAAHHGDHHRITNMVTRPIPFG